MTNTGVNVEISANSSAFMAQMKNVAAIAKASAGEMQKAFTAVKPPVFKAPDLSARKDLYDPAFENNAKAQLTKLKSLLDQQVQAHKNALDQEVQAQKDATARILPQIQRRQLSGTPMAPQPGQWDHLMGTPFEGGRRGAGSTPGKNNAHQLGIVYNMVQDAAQGGPAALANNVPQMMTMIAKSPVLQMLGSVAIPALLGFLTYSVVKNWDAMSYEAGKKIREFQRTVEDDGDILRNAAKDKSKAKFAAADRAKAVEKADAAGLGIGASNAAYGGIVEAGITKINSVAEAVAKQRDLSQQLRELRLRAIEDPAAAARATAAEQKQALAEQLAAEKERAIAVLDLAGKEQEAAQKTLNDTKAALAAFPNTALTPEESLRKLTLEKSLPGLNTRLTDSSARASKAYDGLLGVRGQESLLPQRNALIDEELNQKLAAIQKQKDDDRKEGEIALIKNTVQFRRDLKKIEQDILDDRRLQSEKEKQEWEDRISAQKNYVQQVIEIQRKIKEIQKDAADRTTAQEKQKTQIRESLDIATLRAGGHDRKADKLQRQSDEAAAIENYRKQGFTGPGEAEAMARQQMSNADRAAHPGRIRGAGRKGSGRGDPPSALDYFDSGSMASAQTPNLDEYANRRGIPGVGKPVDHEREAKRAKEEAARTAELAAGKGDAAVPALLKLILKALTGTDLPPSASASDSPRHTIKGAGYKN